MIENQGEFQALCDDDEELQEADTWLLESQALVEELICRIVESKHTLVERFQKQLEFGRSKPTTLQSLALADRARKVAAKRLPCARAAAREADLAKLKGKAA